MLLQDGIMFRLIESSMKECIMNKASIFEASIFFNKSVFFAFKKLQPLLAELGCLTGKIPF